MKKVLTSVVLLFCSWASFATHLVGGEFEILHIEGDSYLFRQIQYFDVVNGNPQAKDENVFASVFRKRDNAFVKTIRMPYRSESLVPYSNPVCTSQRLITNKIVYSTEEVLLPGLFSDPEGYYLVWERCCRNNIITNIVQPDETGQTFYIEFPPIRKNGVEFRNSSPQLFPPLSDYACVDRFYYVDFRGTDPDGDSLVYSLNTPSNSSVFDPLPVPTPAPHPTVTWSDGISSDYQIPGEPTLTINENGFLTVTPNEEGLFVFSVKCEEYRDGQKIGVVVRDFQLFVIDCPDPGVAPEIQAKAPGSDIFLAELDTIVLKVDDDKCFDFNIIDRDGSETIKMRAVPVNFQADIQDIFTTNIGVIEQPEDSLGIEVCLPECPYILGEPYVIDVIAQDFTCPQSLMDTLRLIVLVEPPPNQPPKFTLPIQDEIVATFVEGSELIFDFVVEDLDLDSLLLSVVGDGFELAEYGISIDTTLFENGKMAFSLNWVTDCQRYPFGSKNEFKLKMYVNDADQCNLDHSDSISLDITIQLPANNAPVVLVDNQPDDQELTVYVENTLLFDVRGFDGDATDDISLDAYGVGFDLEDAGIEFERQTGNSNVETKLSWQIDCDDVNLNLKNEYEILLVVEDADKCKVPNADSVKVLLNVLPPINTAPEILVNGKVLEDTIFVDAGSLLDLNISGEDADGDMMALYMSNIDVANSLGVSFNSVSGTSSISTGFNWQTDCGLLSENFQDVAYDFMIVLDDDKCIVPKGDTLMMSIVVRDENVNYDFLPPNVFTPNREDDINETYFVPELPRNNCERQFRSIVIYNRYGIEVYSSTERDFQWEGIDHPAGVYFYLISYTDFSVKGTLSLLR